jgi:signal transduction histidine kinase
VPAPAPRLTGETVHLDLDWFVRKDTTHVAVSYSSASVDLTDGRGAVVAFRDISDRLRVKELEASRARIAQAADDARRAIERDLHDGAQQQFVAVAMRLENARCMIAAAPDDAARLLQAAHADLREAIAELQRLAHGIHPAELSEKGLIPALRTLARRAATPVDVKAPDAGRLHPAIEATAYYIAAEATANAVKHAHAHQVEITLARTPQTLQLTITDDGVGGATISSGTGLQGLHDRADALGGHITLVSPAGGPTVLTADLPILGPQTER